MNAAEPLASVSVVLAALGVAAALEAVAPLFGPGDEGNGRRRANLAMTAQTLLFNLGLGAVAALGLQASSPGLLETAGLPPLAQAAAGVYALDFAFGYFAHRTMHALPWLWRFHRVHHSDVFVDVTTTYRTHPVESLWRFGWLSATVWILGVAPAVVAAYRVVSAVNSVLEHANIRTPVRLDSAVSRIWVTPNMHKLHHSRDAAETDTNYGNLFSLHDRWLGTFTPAERAATVTYGLDDSDPHEAESLGLLLAMPWKRRRGRISGAVGVSGHRIPWRMSSAHTVASHRGRLYSRADMCDSGATHPAGVERPMGPMD